jgi:hypothetical protein
VPGDNQKSVTVSLELYDLLKDLSDKESRSMAGEIDYLVKKEIALKLEMAELEAFRREVKGILDKEAFKGGVSPL